MRSVIIVLVTTILGFSALGQVNLQSGSPEQSFPLINYVDGKAGLSLSVNLSYVGGNGLLVNSVASNVGTGWSLDCGGIITRVQNGEPDDQIERFTGSFSADKNKQDHIKAVWQNYPNGYLYNPFTTSGCNEGLNYYPVFGEKKVYKEINKVASDLKQDKFMFQVNGRTGVFVIGKNFQVTTIGDSRIKVTFSMADMTSQGIRTRINQFVITTEDGIKYTFSQPGITHICRYKYSARDQKGEWYVLPGDPNDDPYSISRFWGYKADLDERPFIINSWYLSEMENPNTGQKIYFNYQDIEVDKVTNTTVSHSRILNQGKTSKPGNYTRTGRRNFEWLKNPDNARSVSWSESLLNKYEAGPTSIFYNKSIGKVKRLSSITLPNSGQITFQYSPVPRIDMPGENALEKISYSVNGAVQRSIAFDFGYFLKNSIRPYKTTFSGFESKFARLCLLSMQKLGTGEDDATEPPYRFSYYTGSTQYSDDIVPASNFLAQDHWGYYNGNVSGLSLTEDHDFLSSEQTQYFRTVLMKHRNPKSGYAKNGMLKSITYPTGGSIEYSYEQNRPSANILPGQYEQLAGGVSVIKAVVYDGEDHGRDIITDYDYKNLQGQGSRWGDERPENYSLSVTEYNRIFIGKLVWNKAGLAYPEAGINTDHLRFVKMMLKLQIGIGISFAINAAVAALPPPFNIIGEVIVIVVQMIKLIASLTSTIEFHRYTLTNSNNMLANPLSAGYGVVQVKNNSPTGYNGKSVYEFTNLQDYPALVPELRWPYTQNQRLAAWAYGLPKKITVYDKDNLPVKQNENFYNYIVSKQANANNQNCDCATQNKRDARGDRWRNYRYTDFTWNQVHWMTPLPYFHFTGRSDLSSTTEKAYTNGQLYYSETTNTITDPMTLLQKGKVIQRDKYSVVIQLTYYPTDYAIPGSAMEKMKQMNAIHVPIATETWLIERDRHTPLLLRNAILSSTVTEYKIYTFGTRQEVKPWKVWELKTKQPISNIIFGNHNAGILIRHPEYFQLKSEMFYDNDGNLIQTNSNENTTSYINDYTSRAVVATVANAAHTHIAYTSFEADGFGGWTFNTAGIKNTGGVTGTKAFKVGLDPATNLTNTITRSGLDPAKTYVITYWVQNVEPDFVLVNGQYGTTLFQQNSGWVLYKQEVTGVSQVTISGDALLDELRLHPKGALMNTVTYKDGVGKTTECDANNRLVYYEYDALGRLKLTRDQNRNIIKTYEYNYKQ